MHARCVSRRIATGAVTLTLTLGGLAFTGGTATAAPEAADRAASAECQQARKGDIVCAACRGHSCNGGRKDRGGCRIGADDEMARRSEQREQGHGHQQSVETGYHGCPGNLRVPHDFRDRDCRKRETCQNFGD